MGKGALIIALAATFITLTVTNTTLITTRETQDVKNRSASNMMARDLALKGRKLVLSHWAGTEGSASSAPFQTLTQDGGTITVTSYSSASNIMDVTLRAEYDGAVHDIRSRYQWNPGGALNPFQIKAADIDFTISNQASLNIKELTLDDQSLAELDEVLIEDLSLGDDLSDFGLGMADMTSSLETSLTDNNHSGISINVVDTADRLQLEQEDGMFFPDQVETALAGYLATNPNKETTITNASSVPASFGTDAEGQVLRVTDDWTVSGNFTGEGILVVEGNFVVPQGASFDWNGLVIIKPPASNQNPQIDFSGVTNLTGGLIIMHEAMPNSGHMDVTTFRDYSGNWYSSTGVDKKLWYWRWCMYHKHDFTSAYGNNITYYSSTSSERIHESQIHFYDTIRRLAGSDDIFLQISNPTAHGRGTITLEIDGNARVTYPASAGFDPSIASASNPYRTQTFKVNDLEYFHIDINRLSSLKKMWDNGSRYPNCSSTSGPLCVGYSYDRQGTLTFQLYKVSGASETKIYEATMYWHRRTDEIDAFNDKMEDLVSDLQSPSYGLDLNMGDNFTLTEDAGAISALNGGGGGGRGVIHLGTWHTHWDPTDKTNPKTCGNYKAQGNGSYNGQGSQNCGNN